MDEQSDVKQIRPPSVLEDPGAQAVAKMYAEAFLDAAQDKGVPSQEALEEFGSFLEDVLAANPPFHKILVSGAIGREDKIALINRVLAPYGSQLFVSFLRVLASHGRLELLPLILAEVQTTAEWREGRRRIQVISAHPLREETLDKIRQRLDAALPFEPILQTATEPELLGGVVIRLGDWVYDGSLRTRLQQLRNRLRKRSLHEIQSERNRFSDSEGN